MSDSDLKDLLSSQSALRVFDLVSGQRASGLIATEGEAVEQAVRLILAQGMPDVEPTVIENLIPRVVAAMMEEPALADRMKSLLGGDNT